MKRSSIVIMLALILLLVNTGTGMAFQSNSGTAPQNTSTLGPQALKIRKQVEKLGLDKDVTVNMNDGREYYGSVKSIEADGFLVYEVDGKQLLTIRYDEVRKVRKGYGVRKDATGKRISPNKALIGKLVAAAAILIPVIIVVASMSREK